MPDDLSTPWGAIIQGVGGLAQSIIGGINARKAQKELEKMQSPTYRANQSIMDYYNSALSRYNASPQDSALYKSGMQNVNRNIAAGIMGLQDRRSTLAGLPAILRAQNDAALNTTAAAEQQRDNRFSQLGQAAGMQADEQTKAYQYNELAPFERKYNLLAQKAAANAQTANAGVSNMFGGLQNWQNMSMVNKMYSNPPSKQWWQK